MEDALSIHRLHFAFTVSYHYIFPQLTMGLALLIVVLKGLALKTKSDTYNRSARFWTKIFAVSFAMGVVTGIPMGALQAFQIPGVDVSSVKLRW